MLRKGHGGLYKAPKKEERRKRKAKRREGSDQVYWSWIWKMASCKIQERKRKARRSINRMSSSRCILWWMPSSRQIRQIHLYQMLIRSTGSEETKSIYDLIWSHGNNSYRTRYCCMGLLCVRSTELQGATDEAEFVQLQQTAINTV